MGFSCNGGPGRSIVRECRFLIATLRDTCKNASHRAIMPTVRGMVSALKFQFRKLSRGQMCCVIVGFSMISAAIRRDAVLLGLLLALLSAIAFAVSSKLPIRFSREMLRGIVWMGCLLAIYWLSVAGLKALWPTAFQ